MSIKRISFEDGVFVERDIAPEDFYADADWREAQMTSTMGQDAITMRIEVPVRYRPMLNLGSVSIPMTENSDGSISF